jgi:hypothetical protein
MDSLSEEEQDFMLLIDEPHSWHASFHEAEMDRKAKERLAAAGMKPHYTFNSSAADDDEIPF